MIIVRDVTPDGSSRQALRLYIVAEDETVGRLLNDLPYETRIFATPAAFLAAVPDPQGVLVLGLQLAKMSGLALQARLAGRPLLSTIFVSGGATIPAVVAAMKGGASDFLLAPVRPQALIDAIAVAMDRLAGMADQPSLVQPGERLAATLTETEREIAALMARGLRNGSIARMTRRAENTVKVHRSRIMRKLGTDHDYLLRAVIGGAGGGNRTPSRRQAAQ